MNQTLFIIINDQSINTSNKNTLSYIEQISSLYKFKIKKLFPELNGALITINPYTIHLIKSNKYITILDDNEIYNNINVLKIFNYNSYKLLMKFKYC